MPKMSEVGSLLEGLGGPGGGILSGIGSLLNAKANNESLPKPNATSVPRFDKGGKVTKTGLAIVDKGDTIANKDGEVSSKPHNVSLYRAMHHLKKGGLHRALGVPEGETIPKEKVDAAKNSKNEHVAKMANFASTMGHFNH